MAKQMLWMDVEMPDFRNLANQIDKINLAKPFKATCEEIVANAWKRFRAKQRAVGGRYRNLDPKTIAHKRKKGFPEPETPLFRTGKMIGDFRFWGKGNKWWVGFRTEDSYLKAIIHIQEGASRARIRRPFLREDFAMTVKERERHGARSRRFIREEFRKITMRTAKRKKRRRI